MVGAWAEWDSEVSEDPGRRQEVSLCIRNSSELPVEVTEAELATVPAGFRDMPLRWQLRTPRIPPRTRTGASRTPRILPGPIPPGQIWRKKDIVGLVGNATPSHIVFTRIVVVDAAGLWWEIRSAKPGPPRRIRWWWRSELRRRADP